MLDVSPSIAADILRSIRLPSRVARSYRRFRHGPGAFKVDFAVEDGVPWTASAVRQAGARSISAVISTRGRHQPGRRCIGGPCPGPGPSCSSASDIRATRRARSATCTTPCGRTRTYRTRLRRRTRPGPSSPRYRASSPPASGSGSSAPRCVRTTEMSAYNANYVGGDVIGGASSPAQLLFRPRFAVDPYFTGVPGTYLCSASTTPGCGSTRNVRRQRRPRPATVWEPPHPEDNLGDRVCTAGAVAQRPTLNRSRPAHAARRAS